MFDPLKYKRLPGIESGIAKVIPWADRPMEVSFHPKIALRHNRPLTSLVRVSRDVPVSRPSGRAGRKSWIGSSRRSCSWWRRWSSWGMPSQTITIIIIIIIIITTIIIMPDGGDGRVGGSRASFAASRFVLVARLGSCHQRSLNCHPRCHWAWTVPWWQNFVDSTMLRK